MRRKLNASTPAVRPPPTTYSSLLFNTGCPNTRYRPIFPPRWIASCNVICACLNQATSKYDSHLQATKVHILLYQRSPHTTISLSAIYPALTFCFFFETTASSFSLLTRGGHLLTCHNGNVLLFVQSKVTRVRRPDGRVMVTSQANPQKREEVTFFPMSAGPEPHLYEIAPVYIDLAVDNYRVKRHVDIVVIKTLGTSLMLSLVYDNYKLFPYFFLSSCHFR